MRISAFEFQLPSRLIAQKLTEPRDHCRLLVLERDTGNITHHHFFELADRLGEGDVLVLNDTKVFPARLLGKKLTGGKAEVLLVRRVETERWEAISKPLLPLGSVVNFGELKMKVKAHLHEGMVLGEFNLTGEKFWEAIELIGHTPLPPYIQSQEAELDLRAEYQTVYAQKRGSVAAPTAGFHFTLELMAQLLEKGVEIHRITLHVSLGTFRPVKTDEVGQHRMHPEWYSLSPQAATALNQAKQEGKRIIAVGTTAARVLEACSDKASRLSPQSGETAIFIFPPYKFKFVDALITNFHLPKSTLLMLVSALISLPNTKYKFLDFKTSFLGLAYQDAIKHGYQFYSFGDAILIH